MKRLIMKAVLAALILAAAPVGAEQITKVAVLDYDRILSAFYAGSETARRIEEMKTIFADDVRLLQEEIQEQ